MTSSYLGPAEGEAHVVRRIPGLDGLRALAVVLVLLVHVFNTTFPGAFIGVDLFFVISGYIITRGLLREQARLGRTDFIGFYVRRARRILPPLWAMLAAVGMFDVLYGGHMSGPGATGWDGVAALSSFMNWRLATGVSTGRFIAHTWSLSIEEQFYFLWPATLVVLLSLKRPKLVILLLILGVVAVAIWRVHVARRGADFWSPYYHSECRADALLLGCLVAFVGTSAIPFRRLWPLALSILGAASLLFSTSSALPALGGFTIVALASALLVAMVVEDVEATISRLLSTPLVQWVGLRSYSLYLWHFPVVRGLQFFGVRELIAAPVAIGGSLVLSELSYRYLERPFHFISHVAPRREPSIISA